MADFWDIAPCSPVEVDLYFRGAYCLHYRSSDDGDSTHLWNVCLLQRDYTALYPRKLSSSYSPFWKTWNLKKHKHILLLAFQYLSYIFLHFVSYSSKFISEIYEHGKW
jgi:hypothetical protein